MFSFLDWILLGLIFVIISFLLWIKFFYIFSISCFILWILIYIFDIINSSWLQFRFFVLISLLLLSFQYLFFFKKKIKKDTKEELEKFIVKNYNGKKIIYFDSNIVLVESNWYLNEWDTVEILEKMNEFQFKVKKIM